MTKRKDPKPRITKLEALEAQTHSDIQRERRQARLQIFELTVLPVLAERHTIKTLTSFQFRIDGILDVYPIHRRYHHIPTGVRGSLKYGALVDDIEHLLEHGPKPDDIELKRIKDALRGGP